ncbi:MAG: TRAP transporter small permease subunit [Thermodesulfobacteriota bacterium]
MAAFRFLVRGISLLLYWISCVAVVCIVFVTVFDVIMRRSGHPVDYAIEVVTIFAGIIISFALPATSLSKDHVRVEFLEGKLSKNWLKAAYILTRCIGMAIFITIGLSTVKLGNNLRMAGQCSPILQIPEFPLPYALSLGCFVESLVLCYAVLGNGKPEEERR